MGSDRRQMIQIATLIYKDAYCGEKEGTLRGPCRGIGNPAKSTRTSAL